MMSFSHPMSDKKREASFCRLDKEGHLKDWIYRYSQVNMYVFGVAKAVTVGEYWLLYAVLWREAWNPINLHYSLLMCLGKTQ